MYTLMMVMVMINDDGGDDDVNYEGDGNDDDDGDGDDADYDGEEVAHLNPLPLSNFPLHLALQREKMVSLVFNREKIAHLRE